MSPTKVNYVVEGLIPENMINLIPGKPGSFKSWFLANLAISAAFGRKLFGAYACKLYHIIIYLDEDSPQSIYEHRLEILATGASIPASIIQLSMTGFRLVDNQRRNELCEYILHQTNQGKRVLFIFDCLAKIAVGLNLDRTEDAVKVMSYIAQIRDAGATVVGSHHVSMHQKGRELMNNTLIKGGCDSIVYIEAFPLENRHICLVRPESKRVLLTIPFAVELISDSENWALMTKIDEIPSIPTDDDKLIFRLFPDVSINWTVKQISDSTGRDLPDSRIRDALSRLVEELCLERVINPHDRSHAAYYKLHHNFTQRTSVYKQLIK